MRGHREKTSIYKTERKPSPELDHDGTLDIGLPGSRAVRKELQ
jgi:hypothetical protein